jgi:hypothetical protein
MVAYSLVLRERFRAARNDAKKHQQARCRSRYGRQRWVAGELLRWGCGHILVRRYWPVGRSPAPRTRSRTPSQSCIPAAFNHGRFDSGLSSLWANGPVWRSTFEVTGSLLGPLAAHALVNGVNLSFLKRHDPDPDAVPRLEVGV